MTPDEPTRVRSHPDRGDASYQSDPDEYVPIGDGVDDPEEVVSGDRPVGRVDEPHPVPSGESEEDLAAEDLGADPVLLDEEDEPFWEQ